MAYDYPNFSRVSKRHFISGYDVTIAAGVGDTILFTILDPCSTLSNQCLAKAVLMKAYRDYLVDNGFTAAAADTACKDGCCCDQGGDSVAFYAGNFSQSFTTTAVGAPVGTLTVNVKLPLECVPGSTFDGVAYTTLAP